MAAIQRWFLPNFYAAQINKLPFVSLCKCRIQVANATFCLPDASRKCNFCFKTSKGFCKLYFNYNLLKSTFFSCNHFSAIKIPTILILSVIWLFITILIASLKGIFFTVMSSQSSWSACNCVRF